MNAVRTLRVPLHLLALAAAAALLTAAAFLALGSAAQAALSDAQRGAQLNLSLADESDNIVPADSTMGVIATISFTVEAPGLDRHGPFGSPIYLQSGGKFRVTRGLEWGDSGRSALTLNERATSGGDGPTMDNPATPLTDETAPAPAADVFGKLDDGNCSARTEAQTTTWTCNLAIKHGATPQGTEVPGGSDSGILIPDGTPDGPITITASVKINDAAGNGSAAGAVTLTDTLTVTVGKIVEVQTATLDFATQEAGDLALNGVVGDPWPSIVSFFGGQTRLQLSMLNAGGKASARNSVSQLQLTTTTGRLSSVTLGDNTCQGGDRQRVCVVDVSKLNATNSDRIIMRVEPPLDQSASTAIVRGSLLTTDGRTFSLGPLRIRFAGPAIALDINEPTSGLLNTATADDNLDQLLISVGATDARGYQTDVPTATDRVPHRSTVKDPDGKTVAQSASGISVDWPYTRNGLNVRDAQGRIQARITVGAAAASPLKVGQYSLELSAGGFKQSVPFTLQGPTAAIAVATDAEEIGLGGLVTLTATLTTAEGQPVLDGTQVSFAERSFAEGPTVRTAVVNGSTVTITESSSGPAPTVLVMRSQATQRTKDGQASVTLRAVAAGRAYVTVFLGDEDEEQTAPIKGALTITVSSVSATADPAQLSSTAPNQYSVWLGSLPVRASQLLPQLTGVAALHKWTGETWLTHTTADPTTDFIIDPGNTLWLSAE